MGQASYSETSSYGGHYPLFGGCPLLGGSSEQSLIAYNTLMMSNDHYRTENLSAVFCFSGSTIQHQAVGMSAIQKIAALKKKGQLQWQASAL